MLAQYALLIKRISNFIRNSPPLKKKIKLLIAAAIFGLIALSIIQGYLINNTYKLKKDAFINEMRRSVSQIDDFSPVLDSLSDIWQDHFLNKIADYKVQQATKADILKGLQFVIDSINGPYKAEYQNELKKLNIPYEIKFQKKVLAIVLEDSTQSDTIFDFYKTPKNIILGNAIDNDKAIGLSTTLWQTDHTSSRTINGEQKDIEFYLAFKTRDIMDLQGWRSVVIKEMMGLLLLSLIIFSVVIGLLYFSIKSLVLQKKIADIKTDFVNNITHELKTPLATLTLATKMLKTKDVLAKPEMINNTIGTIERQNTRLQNLIDQVLSNSVGYQDINLNKESVNPRVYFDTVFDDFLLSVKSKSVQLNRAYEGDQKHIELDRFYMTTALLNILDNAVKYFGEDLHINCKIQFEEQLRITISDNGIGISQKDKKQIFEKFYRAGHKEIHDVKGLGLGLYYTTEIVKAHLGTIEVKSLPSEGTTFILKLPLN